MEKSRIALALLIVFTFLSLFAAMICSWVIGFMIWWDSWASLAFWQHTLFVLGIISHYILYSFVRAQLVFMKSIKQFSDDNPKHMQMGKKVK